MSEKEPAALAAALVTARTGEDAALSALFPLVYTQLRRIAGGYFRGKSADQTLQPTALVHEAFLRLLRTQPGCYQDRTHFIAVAAVAMRQILIDHARKRGAAKRGGNAQRETFEDGRIAVGQDASLDVVDVLALDVALKKLEAVAPRQARIIELQYFGGLTVDEVANVLGVSKGLVEKDWRRARAFVKSALEGPEPAAG